jgi:hypothetical protein
MSLSFAMSHRSDVVVIGAGPYGLAAAAHLRAAGADVSVFGRPMSFWSEHMPKEMLLRSPWPASTIGDPANAYTLDEYEAAIGPIPKPLPLERFVAYGEWFRRSAGIGTDEREPRIGHLSALQRSSRAPDGTPMHIRMDGAGFNNMDVPSGRGFGSGNNLPKLQFMAFFPSAEFFRVMRINQASLDLEQHFDVEEADSGLERFTTTTRRQNFLSPPRRHRAFPLVEVT